MNRKKFIKTTTLSSLAIGLTGPFLHTIKNQFSVEPVRLIFDTDMDTDCDDAGALAMVHTLADREEINLLGTMVSTRYQWSGQCVAAINNFFSRPDLPVGVPKGDGNIEQGDNRGSRYARQIAREFPHDFPLAEEAPDAVKVYREILNEQPDNSVVIVTVGYLTNIRYLLESEPDEHSSLNGIELVKQKVKYWVCMGSRYPADLDPNPWGNFKPDAPSTVKAVKNWPGKIIFTGGGEFAQLLATGEKLRETREGNPIRRLYELYFDGEAESRHSADQIAVLVAARGTGHPWKLVTHGYNHIFSDGRHEWRTETDNPNHSFISALMDDVDPADVIRMIEELMIDPLL